MNDVLHCDWLLDDCNQGTISKLVWSIANDIGWNILLHDAHQQQRAKCLLMLMYTCINTGQAEKIGSASIGLPHTTTWVQAYKHAKLDPANVLERFQKLWDVFRISCHNCEKPRMHCILQLLTLNVRCWHQNNDRLQSTELPTKQSLRNAHPMR